MEYRGIVFNIETRKVVYKGKDIWLIESDEECKECFYGTECQHKKSIFSDNETLGYRNYACPYRDAIKVLRSKIYHDKGEIEVHLLGSFKDVHDYSEVKYYPEILNTIEKMINKFFKYCSEEYYSLDDANNNFYGNLYLLSTGIPVICGETPERYGQLLVDTKIPMEKINIEEYSV